MKKILYVFFILSLALASCALASCSKEPLNEVDASYFMHEFQTRVVFEDKGRLAIDPNGNLSIGCVGYPEYVTCVEDVIHIIIPKDSYSIDNNKLSFSNSFMATVGLFSYCGGPDSMPTDYHLQQETKVRIGGTITNNTANNFFQLGNVYSCPVSLSFSLGNGCNVRLLMKTITVVTSIKPY